MRNPRGLDEAAVAGLLADMNARLDLTHYEELTTISIDYQILTTYRHECHVGLDSL